MRRRHRLLVLACLAALVLPSSASAAQRMYVGFQDDRSFRWADERVDALDRARDAGGAVVRTTVYWHKVAPRRPANAANPFDPAYQLYDVDELVRNAQVRGMEVMLTIWGTPPWANGNRGLNRLPNRLADLTAFSRALASRYSGRHPGYPMVRFFTIGNEPNLEMFLAPQFDARGRSVGPRNYARMFRAAHAGIKQGNPLALVGIGETSPRGRDVRSPGRAQDSHSPGRFAELVSKARPKVKFDAWAHHPYPTAPHLRPTQRVRWPNVTLSQLPRFEQSLQRWFGRRVPIWITEYGHETRPEEPKGVTRAQQAAFTQQALTIARRDANVELFIWFQLRDDFSGPQSWQSGLYDRNWNRKPALARFRAIARAVDGRNPRLVVRPNVANPLVRFAALELKPTIANGARVGINYRVLERGRPIANGQAAPAIGRDGWVAFRPAFRPTAKRAYVLEVRAENINGSVVDRRIELTTVG